MSWNYGPIKNIIYCVVHDGKNFNCYERDVLGCKTTKPRELKIKSKYPFLGANSGLPPKANKG